MHFIPQPDKYHSYWIEAKPPEIGNYVLTQRQQSAGCQFFKRKENGKMVEYEEVKIRLEIISA